MDILNVVLGITSISFLITYIRTMKKLNVLSSGFSELYLTYTALQEARAELAQQGDTGDSIHKENFIKFLSDSRDWAFTYIEDVQEGLEKFIQEVEPHIEYYDQYGPAVEGMMPPHDNALKTISKEFKELKKLLPEEVDDRR